MTDNTNWYVIQVNTGSEYKMRDMIVAQLDQTGVSYEDCFVPMVEYVRKGKHAYEQKMRPMFPGYVFLISCAADSEAYDNDSNADVAHDSGTSEQDNIWDIVRSLRRIIGFTKILGDSQNYIPLYPGEVDFLLSFSDVNHNVSMSYGVIENDQVMITEGPLMGQEGRIKKINRHKRIAEIEVPFMGRTTKVQVSLEIVTKR